MSIKNVNLCKEELSFFVERPNGEVSSIKMSLTKKMAKPEGNSERQRLTTDLGSIQTDSETSHERQYQRQSIEILLSSLSQSDLDELNQKLGEEELVQVLKDAIENEKKSRELTCKVYNDKRHVSVSFRNLDDGARREIYVDLDHPQESDLSNMAYKDLQKFEKDLKAGQGTQAGKLIDAISREKQKRCLQTKMNKATLNLAEIRDKSDVKNTSILLKAGYTVASLYDAGFTIDVKSLSKPQALELKKHIADTEKLNLPKNFGMPEMRREQDNAVIQEFSFFQGDSPISKESCEQKIIEKGNLDTWFAHRPINDEEINLARKVCEEYNKRVRAGVNPKSGKPLLIFEKIRKFFRFLDYPEINFEEKLNEAKLTDKYGGIHGLDKIPLYASKDQYKEKFELYNKRVRAGVNPKSGKPLSIFEKIRKFFRFPDYPEINFEEKLYDTVNTWFAQFAHRPIIGGELNLAREVCERYNTRVRDGVNLKSGKPLSMSEKVRKSLGFPDYPEINFEEKLYDTVKGDYLELDSYMLRVPIIISETGRDGCEINILSIYKDVYKERFKAGKISPSGSPLPMSRRLLNSFYRKPYIDEDIDRLFVQQLEKITEGCENPIQTYDRYTKQSTPVDKTLQDVLSENGLKIDALNQAGNNSEYEGSHQGSRWRNPFNCENAAHVSRMADEASIRSGERAGKRVGQKGDDSRSLKRRRTL